MVLAAAVLALAPFIIALTSFYFAAASVAADLHAGTTALNVGVGSLLMGFATGLLLVVALPLLGPIIGGVLSSGSLWRAIYAVSIRLPRPELIRWLKEGGTAFQSPPLGGAWRGGPPRPPAPPHAR
jgi:hypothetical protein